jgi:hypothetical protein
MSDTFEGFEDGDSSLIIDMDSVKEQSFEAVPRGTYNAEFDTMELAKSKSSGQPMWKGQIRITDGPYVGRKLFYFLSFSEKALPGTKSQLAKISPDIVSGSMNIKALADQQVLVGKPCRVKIDIEKYDGNDTNRIKGFLAPAGGSDGFFA